MFWKLSSRSIWLKSGPSVWTGMTLLVPNPRPYISACGANLSIWEGKRQQLPWQQSPEGAATLPPPFSFIPVPSSHGRALHHTVPSLALCLVTMAGLLGMFTVRVTSFLSARHFRSLLYPTPRNTPATAGNFCPPRPRVVHTSLWGQWNGATEPCRGVTGSSIWPVWDSYSALI